MNADPTSPDVAAVEGAARRAYEWSMLRVGFVRAIVVTAGVAALVATGIARLPSLAWLALVFAVWLFVGWRGALMWRGARAGLVAGLGALVLPLSILRPCCAAMTSATSCSRPELSIGAGVLLGALVTAALPRFRSTAEWGRAAGGAILAVASLVACRCAALFLGESIGLLGGLLAAAAGVAFARAWWSGRRTT